MYPTSRLVYICSGANSYELFLINAFFTFFCLIIYIMPKCKSSSSIKHRALTLKINYR